MASGGKWSSTPPRLNSCTSDPDETDISLHLRCTRPSLAAHAEVFFIKKRAEFHKKILSAAARHRAPHSVSDILFGDCNRLRHCWQSELFICTCNCAKSWISIASFCFSLTFVKMHSMSSNRQAHHDHKIWLDGIGVNTHTHMTSHPICVPLWIVSFSTTLLLYVISEHFKFKFFPLV